MKDQVACITLNRPKAFNSFNRPMALQLQSILDNCEKDESVRAILLTGNGKQTTKDHPGGNVYLAKPDGQHVVDTSLGRGSLQVSTGGAPVFVRISGIQTL